MDDSQEIVLDCEPGVVRPGDLIPGFLEGTGIEPVEASSKLFGSCTFKFDHIDKSVWETNQKTFEERIKLIFDQGLIRYGSW
jgi:hypothetical protein|eukprot:3811629-Prymnesium_polylepis.1